MMCPKCGEQGLCLETRNGPNFTKIRKRMCPRGHKFQTREIHEPVYCSAKPRALNFARTMMRRIGIYERDLEIVSRWSEGSKALMVAFGLTRTTLFLIRKNILRDQETQRDHTSKRPSFTRSKDVARSLSSAD